MMNHVILSIQGESVAHSGVSVSVRDLVCLLLVLLLLLYSCYNCYRQWKKNYQLPPGDFVAFKGKAAEEEGFVLKDRVVNQGST